MASCCCMFSIIPHFQSHLLQIPYFYDIIGDDNNNIAVLIIRRKCSASRSYKRVNLIILTHSLYLESRDGTGACVRARLPASCISPSLISGHI